MGLLPKDEVFYTLFVEQSARVVEAAEIFCSALRTGSTDWDAIAKRMDSLETAGDDCAHRTIERLALSFITPFDPEDIHRLAIGLNSILDCLDGLSERCRIYALANPPAAMKSLADSIEAGARSAHEAIQALAVEKDAPNALANIRRLEIEADHVYRDAMFELFRSETDVRVLLTTHQIYDGLEAATDRFETLSYLIQEIRLKNS